MSDEPFSFDLSDIDPPETVEKVGKTKLGKTWKGEEVAEEKKKKGSPSVSVEKIMVSRIVHKDGTISTAWADKDSIHVDALKHYDKFKEFY